MSIFRLVLDVVIWWAVIVIMTWIFVGCGKPETHDGRTKIHEPTEASPCVIIQFKKSARIQCPDGSSADIYNGMDGADGEDGKDGRDGRDGTDGVDGSDGEDGVDNTRPIYVGYFCNRIVLKIGETFYVNNSQLVPLTKDWYHIGSCKLKIKSDGSVEVD